MRPYVIWLMAAAAPAWLMNVSPRTAQYHLHKGFRKPNITSRSQLGRAPPSYLNAA